MARVRPFAAWRYASPNVDISALAAPPYDVISDSQREALLQRDARNVVALELPDGGLDPQAPGNRYETGQRTWEAWRTDGTLSHDEEPAVYVLEQRFTLANREVSRRAFIVEVGLEPLDAGIILPHERTLPKALGDRFELIKATGANLSQVFGLFDDEECSTTALYDAVMAGEPIATALDDDGVLSTLWASTDTAHAKALASFMCDRQVFIADGHHRYTTALAHRDLCRAEALETGTADTDPAYDYVMMALVNMDDPDLAVLPYNRIADAPGAFDPSAFKSALAEHFDLTELSAGEAHGALDGFERPAFLVKTAADELPFVASLKASVNLDSAIDLPQSTAWKSLDVAVLQELVLWPILGIHPDKPETLDRISFTKDAHAALGATTEHDVAFVVRPTRLEQLREVALAGEAMPQKSTYFYPKLLSGLVFRDARHR